jgi:DNA-binding Lrp family transcriptional regulator
LITKRDRRVCRFIEDFRIATTKQIYDLCFENLSIRRCQQRLTELVKQKRIKRYRDYVSQDYLYYVGKKPSQVEHDLLRTKVFMELRKYDLQEFRPEFSYGNLRADGYFELGDDPWFLEIQLSTGFNQEKYEMLYRRLDWRERWREFPKVLVVSNKKIRIEHSDIGFYVVGCDLVGMEKCIGYSQVGSSDVRLVRMI